MAIPSRSMWFLFTVALCSFLFRTARAQIGTNGDFTFPTIGDTNFAEGAFINITWETDYNRTNLYLIQGGHYDQPEAIGSNIATPFLYWQVKTSKTNLTDFVFRIVNAQGTEEEKTGGGFASSDFDINRDQSASSTTAAASSTSSSSAAASSTASLIPPSSSASHTSSLAVPTDTSTTTPVSSHSGMSSGEKVGIGLGVGLGLPLLIATVVGVYILGRSQARKNARGVEQASATELVKHDTYPTNPYRDTPSYHEAPTPSYHEAPGDQTHPPQELHGRNIDR